MRYVLSVLLLVALLPAAVAQDKGAEKLFHDMEKKIKAASAVQIAVDVEIRAIGEEDNNFKDKVFKAKGFLLLTKDNKMQMKIRGENVGMEMVSSGKELTLAGDEGLLADDAPKPMPTPKYLHDLVSTLVGRTGVLAGSVIIRFAPGPQFDLVLLKLGEFDPEKLRWGVSDFKAGAMEKVGGRDARVISFRFGGGGPETLWLDSKTLLPLKRVYTLEKMHITEIYTAFNLDPRIDDKAFELMPTPNEAEKLFRATLEKIKAAPVVQIAFDSVAKAKDKEARAKGILLFTKDNKARLKLITNETGKEVTIEAISDGNFWKMAASPATLAREEAERARKDLHSLFSTRWAEDGFFSVHDLFIGPAGPKSRLVDFEFGALEKVGGRDAKVVTFSVLSLGPVCQVTLWIDAETLLPLKRLIVTEAGRGTETCNFNLKPKIEAGTFALPK